MSERTRDEFLRKKKELKGHRTFNRLHQKEIFCKKLQQKTEWFYVSNLCDEVYYFYL